MMMIIDLLLVLDRFWLLRPSEQLLDVTISPVGL